jgi:hypothetical protein
VQLLESGERLMLADYPVVPLYFFFVAKPADETLRVWGRRKSLESHPFTSILHAVAITQVSGHSWPCARWVWMGLGVELPHLTRRSLPALTEGRDPNRGGLGAQLAGT